VRLSTQEAHASSGHQNPSALAHARWQENGSLPLGIRRPAHDSIGLRIEVGLRRTVGLNRVDDAAFHPNRLSRCALRSDDTETIWKEAPDTTWPGLDSGSVYTFVTLDP
jgi:hypothetical protein